MVGAFFHVLYVVASIYVHPASIIIAAALGGVGAAVLWPVSGVRLHSNGSSTALRSAWLISWLDVHHSEVHTADSRSEQWNRTPIAMIRF